MTIDRDSSNLTPAQQGAAPDRLQLRSFLAALSAAGELGRSVAARGIAGRVKIMSMDFDTELNEKTSQVLKTYGVPLAEHYVMGTVGYLIWLPADELAEHTVKLVEGDNRGNFSPREYLDAVNECIKKGWLKTYVPEKDGEEQKALSQSADSSDMQFNEGDVKFTKAGYLLYRQTIIEIFGEGIVGELDFASNGIVR